MPMVLTNLKTNFSIVEDDEENPYAVDHEKYPDILNDKPETEYEVHPVTKRNNNEGEVIYDSVIKMERHQLKPKFVRQG